MKRTCYLANPLGFSSVHQATLLRIEQALGRAAKSYGVELHVIEPFRDNNSPSVMEHADWPLRVARSDRDAIDRSDCIFAVLENTPPDEGVFWELGYAAARLIPCFFFRSDFRKCTDNDFVPFNLMALAGLPNRVATAEEARGYLMSTTREIECGATSAFHQWLASQKEGAP